MTTPEPHPPAPSLSAHIEERILAPLRRNAAAARTWFVLSLAAVLVLHASILAFLLYHDRAAPRQVAQETPIEVIVEPPKEQPKPPPAEKKPEAPKQQAKREIEPPASSAPRAPSETKVDTTKLDSETHAPKAPAPLQDGQPKPAESASPTPKVAQEEKVEEADAKPEAPEKNVEALDKAVPEPKPRPKALAKAPPRAKTRRVKTALERLAGTSALPDYKFARPTKKSPVYGGTEDSRYLAIVYGMIMRHRTRFALPDGDSGSVTVAFTVDDDGNLVGMGIEHSSGYPQVDSAAASAIRLASPFPPPPAGSPRGLIATIDFGEESPTYTMGSQAR